MYERSAIVLEKNFNNIFGFDKKVNLKTIYKNYKIMIEEIQKYQAIIEEEDKVINEFDESANEIRSVQQEQKKIFKSNIKLEDERNQLFDCLDEEPIVIEKKLKKIEETINKNNKRLEDLREEFINTLTKFSDKQKERNKYSRTRRTEEKAYLQIIEKSNKDMNEIDISVLKNMKAFVNSENEDEKSQFIEVMISNGKDEKVPFNKEVIENAVNVRNKIAKEEAICYMIIYERIRRLLLEVNGDEIKLDKYLKALRDTSVKLAFLKAEKNYIVSFLDNERMTAIYGAKVHKQLMQDACKNFEIDMEQFNNLYELIVRETSGKSTKKVYRELYNKEYLKNIEEKSRNFEKEISNIKINAGTTINSNYWRIEEIKNVYEVFQKEVSEKFEKDLSEFKLEEPVEVMQQLDKKLEIEDEIFKAEISDEDAEYIEEYEYDEDGYDDDNDEYEDDLEYENEDDSKENYELEDVEENDENYYNSEYDDEDDEFEYYEEDEEDEFEYEEFEYEDDEEDDDDDFEYYEDDEEDDDDNDEYYDNKQEKSKSSKGLFNKLFKDKKD